MRKTAVRWAALAAVVTLFLIRPAAGQAPAGQGQPAPAPAPAEGAAGDQQPVFRGGVNFVRVDVIVTDKQGNPVTDLTPADFEVLEDGKPQSVETFRLVSVDTSAPVETTGRPIRSRADEEQAAANEDARIFVFFLDDYHVRLGNSLAARRQLVDFVQRNLAPTDLVAVMYPLTPLDAVTLTRDHESVVRMLERFEGRKFNYDPRNSAEERYALYPAEQVERIRREVSLSALKALSIKLGSLREGRKAVLVVSEGYTAVLPPQLRDPVATMPGVGNPNRYNPGAGENSNLEDRAQFFGGLDVQRELESVYDAANRNNTAFYTVDPRGLATGEFDINENVGMRMSQDQLRATQDTLRVLADQTDGRAIVNRNDLAKGMAQIVRDSSAYYLIGYNSTPAPQDGKFHEIKVRVKRSGLQVRSRKGYWALTEDEVARATAPPEVKAGPPAPIMNALADLAEPTRGRYVRTWLGTRRGTDGQTEVTLVWEPIPPSPGIRRENASSVQVIAASADGDLVYRGDLAEAGDGSADGGAAGPVRGGASVRFEAPPGTLDLRLAVKGESGTIDVDERRVEVPDLTAPAVTLDTPRVHVARNALEYRALRAAPDAVPVATREFRRTDRLVVRVDAYGPGDVAPTVTSRLLNRLGQPMTDLPVAAPADPAAPFLVDLPLASLPPGEFLLEIAAAGPDGADPVKELVAFKVVS
ncbi:MAG: VWA domain-containing protein [Vicinamibacterales bacterium]